MRVVYYIILALAVLVIGVAVLFTIQNVSRVADLSLSLGLAGFHLAQPMPIPYLLWIAFGAGLLLGGGWGLQQRISAGQRIRKLQKKYARSALQNG
jgi:hypothetical protein